MRQILLWIEATDARMLVQARAAAIATIRHEDCGCNVPGRYVCTRDHSLSRTQLAHADRATGMYAVLSQATEKSLLADKRKS